MSRTTHKKIKSYFEINRVSRLSRRITSVMSSISAPAPPGSVSSGLTRADTRWTSTSPSRTTTTSSPSSASPRWAPGVMWASVLSRSVMPGAALLCGAELWDLGLVQGWRQVPLAHQRGQGQEHHPLQVIRLGDFPQFHRKCHWIQATTSLWSSWTSRRRTRGGSPAWRSPGPGSVWVTPRGWRASRLPCSPTPRYGTAGPRTPWWHEDIIWLTCYGESQVTEGDSVELVCSVTVGQQYNTVSMLPVYADWDWERWVPGHWDEDWPLL